MFVQIVEAIKSFGKTDPHYLLKCALVGWVAPVLFPAAAFTVAWSTNYKMDQYNSSYVGK